MPDGRVQAAVHGFDSPATAADYDRARPSYPAAAVAYIVGHGGIGPGRRVLDLAAGTGKLTRLLVATSADVVAVEPVPAMRVQFATWLPDVELLDGTAEALPLPDGSVDVVTIAQAFHWFDPGKALAEIYRVLRPGGQLFVLWNTRDRSVGWVEEFGNLLVDGDSDMERPYDSYYDVDYTQLIADSSDAFGPAEVWSHEWSQPFDEDLLVARAASVSVVGRLDEARREAVCGRVRRLARTHPDLAGRGWFPFPYLTRIWWCTAIS